MLGYCNAQGATSLKYSNNISISVEEIQSLTEPKPKTQYGNSKHKNVSDTNGHQVKM